MARRDLQAAEYFSAAGRSLACSARRMRRRARAMAGLRSELVRAVSKREPKNWMARARLAGLEDMRLSHWPERASWRSGREEVAEREASTRERTAARSGSARGGVEVEASCDFRAATA